MTEPKFMTPAHRRAYAENLLEQTLLRDCSPEISA